MPVIAVNRKSSLISQIRALAIGVLIVFGLLLGSLPQASYAAESVGRETGLPLPRFVSFKRKSVNLRVGPGRKYAIKWQYRRKGLPVEVIQEFDQWRRVRDSEGATGWVLHSLLSSRRMGIVAPWQREIGPKGEVLKAAFFKGRGSASAKASMVARPQAGLQVALDQCTGDWCRVSAKGHEFWLEQDKIWGTYLNEQFAD